MPQAVMSILQSLDALYCFPSLDAGRDALQLRVRSSHQNADGRRPRAGRIVLRTVLQSHGMIGYDKGNLWVRVEPIEEKVQVVLINEETEGWHASFPGKGMKWRLCHVPKVVWCKAISALPLTIHKFALGCQQTWSDF